MSVNLNSPAVCLIHNSGLKIAEIKPFLKDPNKTSLSEISTTTINDLIPEKIKEFETLFTDRVRKLAPYALDQDENDKKEFPLQFEISKVNYVEEMVNIRWNAFKAGDNMFHVSTLFPDKFSVQRGFFNLFEQNKLNQSKVKKAELRQKLSERAFKGNISKIYEAYRLFFNTLDDTSTQIFQIRFFYKVTQRLQKPLEELNEQDIAACGDILKSLVEQEKQSKSKEDETKTQEANLVFKSLFEEEASKSSKSKKSKNKAKRHTQLQTVHKKVEGTKPKEVALTQVISTRENPLNSVIVKLNSPSCKLKFTLDPRILRWHTSNLDKIKEFEDSGKKKYKQFGNERLSELRNNHCLIGIERVLSDDELSKTYSFSYSFKDEHGESKMSRGFYAVKLFGKKKEGGIIYIGIGNDNVIYHAMFEPLNEKFLVPKDIVKAFEIHKDSVSVEEEKWDQVSFCTFSLSEKNVIQMDIGPTKEERVTYQLYPIK